MNLEKVNDRPALNPASTSNRKSAWTTEIRRSSEKYGVIQVLRSRKILMPGINPYAYLQQVAGRLPHLTERREIETLLDEVEYLYEAIEPELQEPATQLIEQLRKRLETVS